MFVCVILLFFNIMFVRFTHVAACGYRTFSLPHRARWLYHNVCIHSTIEGHCSCWFGPDPSWAHILVCTNVLIFGRHILHVELLDHWVCVSPIFISKAKPFSPIFNSIGSVWESCGFLSNPKLVIVCFLNFHQIGGWVRIFPCSFNLHFFSEVEQLCIYFLIIWISSFSKFQVVFFFYWIIHLFLTEL